MEKYNFLAKHYSLNTLLWWCHWSKFYLIEFMIYDLLDLSPYYIFFPFLTLGLRRVEMQFLAKRIHFNPLIHCADQLTSHLSFVIRKTPSQMLISTWKITVVVNSKIYFTKVVTNKKKQTKNRHLWILHSTILKYLLCLNNFF